MDIILKTDNLGKNFGQSQAVNNINLSIRRNSIYGLVGRNGAGKSSLMRMLAGLMTPSKGTITFNGERLSRKSEDLKQIGCLIEAPALYPNLTAYENLKVKSLACERYQSDDRISIKDILEIIGLDSTSKKRVKSFSLGMKQRLGIGMALVGNPEFLILDEPINGLDPNGIMDMRKLLKSINENMGITMLISSHILEELSKLATDFGIMSNGCMIKELSQSELHEEMYVKGKTFEDFFMEVT